MDLATIDITETEAVAKLAEYETQLGAERSAEDHALAQAYRAARRGLPIIRLSDAVHAGGYFDDGLPRIAVVRADAVECHVAVGWRSRSGQPARFIYADHRDARSRGALVGRHTVAVDVPGHTHTYTWRGHTVVPLIPPRHRPRRPRLASCHLLWEVESWTPAPPVDPALIRHIRGDLWAVLAVWDLTELERAVLSQRRP